MLSIWKRHKLVIHSLILVVLFIQTPSRGQTQDDLKLQIESAIRAGSDYASNVLLDENGKSRCEYSILEGRWQDYEPAWHTGQIIYALTRAFDITGKKA